MKAALLGVSAVVLLLAALALGAFFLIRTEWAERRIEQLASEKLGREVNVEELALALAWPPAVTAERIRIANPEWAKSEQLLDAEGVRASFDAGALLGGQAVLERLSVERGFAGLEKDAGRATWKFGTEGERSNRFKLGRVDVDEGHVFYADHQRDTALDIKARGTAGSEQSVLHLEASGTFRGEKARAKGKAPALLLSGGEPIRLDVQASVGPTSGAFTGSFAATSEGIGPVDADVELKGKSLAGLENILGFELPETPPYQVSGKLHHEAQLWALRGLDARVGQSDLHGDFSYRGRPGQRPLIEANLTARRLDFGDLGRKARQAEKSAGLFPEAKFETDGWDAVDADVRLKAERVSDSPLGTLANLNVRMVLEDSLVRLEPLELGVAGGTVDGELVLDARRSPLLGSLDARLRGIQPGKLSPAAKEMKGSLGRVYGKVALAGAGQSVQQLLATSDGKVTAMMSEGSVSAFLVELLGLDLGEALLVVGSKDKAVKVRCAVSDFDVKDGVASTDAFVIDTTDTRVSIRGKVHLGEERLDLTVFPQPKDASFLAAPTPIEVRGTLKDPQVRPRAGPLAGRAAAAGLLGLVNPLLALAPFVEPGAGEGAPCGALLAAAKKEAGASVGTSKGQ